MDAGAARLGRRGAEMNLYTRLPSYVQIQPPLTHNKNEQLLAANVLLFTEYRVTPITTARPVTHQFRLSLTTKNKSPCRSAALEPCGGFRYVGSVRLLVSKTYVWFTVLFGAERGRCPAFLILSRCYQCAVEGHRSTIAKPRSV